MVHSLFFVYPVRFELTTLRLKGGCSQALRNQLSYGYINYLPLLTTYGNSPKGGLSFIHNMQTLQFFFQKKCLKEKLEEYNCYVDFCKNRTCYLLFTIYNCSIQMS